MSMQHLTIQEALASYGLSPKEVKIYLASLELGNTTATRISEKSDLNRSTTYDILKSFLEKGIASKVVKNKTAHYEVVEPKRLVTILDDKKKKLLSVMDQLELLQKTKIEKPTTEMYEGKAGVETILSDILSTKNQIDVISTSKIFDIFIYYFPHYIQQRSKLGLKTRVIQERSSSTKKLRAKDKLEHRQTRSLEKFEINSVTFIYGDKIATIKLIRQDLWGLLVKDKVLAEDKKKIFEILWANAK